MVQVRGVEQLQTPVGLELFITVLRMQMALSNIHSKLDTPAWLLRLAPEALNCCFPRDPALDIFFLYPRRVSTLRDSIRVGQPDSVIDEALGLDTALVEWALSLDSRWQYKVLPVTSDDQGCYGDYYHIYPDHVASLLWSNYRCIRLAIHAIICELCEELPSHRDAESDKRSNFRRLASQSARVQKQLAEDMCASVPTNIITDGSRFTGGMALRFIWPLFTVANCEGSSAEIRSWITRCLEKIGEELGIQQASAMARILREGDL
ncbi:hypothetical protein BDV29DRAFT_109977 [Aspergillus leporis]|uniref:Uncharacterized protein n=1 Tax=Aspergillus leporis TaxID=41062 RepID=A0A5N5WFQ2_9EURO|nr:hypothetical protein BDV29DRAFT_109977 [Aspergillus leporis]